MLSLFIIPLLCIRSSSGLPQATSGRWVIGQSVKTTSGIVGGHEARWPAGTGTSEYLGIPYGQNPTGDLRFAAPLPFRSNGTLPGDRFSEECAQIGAGVWSKIRGLDIPQSLIAFGKALEGDENVKFGEDCLKLNVWTKPQTGEKKKAVMIWIYGGAYSAGVTSSPYYNPARYAAEHDIVAVSINYRLNVLGFPGATFVPEKNPGLLDQRLAVEWVRDNVANFGGDPARIVLFGESAGGSSVDFYSYAWTKDPIVSGFIAQSGTATGLPGNPQEDSPWWTISKNVSCGAKSVGPASSLSCMRKVPIEKLMEGVKNVGVAGSSAGGASSILSFWPVVDGKTVFADAWDREKKGLFIRKPMLTGNLDSEGNIILGGVNEGLKWATSQPGSTGSTAQSVKSAYDWISNSDNGGAAALRFFLRFIQDGVFNCPASTAAAARAAYGVPVWRYRFMGVWDNLLLGGVGAYHVSDVPLVMGTTEQKEGAGKNEPEQEILIGHVMKAWSTFAKDPSNGLTKLGWPKYDPNGKTLIRLGYQNKGKPSIGMSAEYDKNCKAQKHIQPKQYPKSQ